MTAEAAVNIQTRAKKIEQIQAEYPNLDRLMIDMVLDTPAEVLTKIIEADNKTDNPYKTPDNMVVKAVEIN